MEPKITQGIFIRLIENYSEERTKLSKISSIVRGNELYKKFEVIQLFKAKQKDNTEREIYKIVLTVEYAYDALNLIEKYCDNGYSNRYTQSYPRGPKYYINRHPERREYEGVPLDQKATKIKIKGMDFYNILEITNSASTNSKKFWFIPAYKARGQGVNHRCVLTWQE